MRTVSAGHFAPLPSIDPRARIVASVVWSVIVVACSRLSVLGAALVVATVAAGLSGLPWAVIVRRVMPLNVVMLLLASWMLVIMPGTPLVSVGPIELSADGGRLALAIALKGNAVLLMLIALLGAMDAVVLGHALHHLRVPDKLAHLLLFTVRYLDVLHREYLRLRTAMKARAFTARMNRHTYRSLGYLVAMLLVRSFDRAERIAAAMKCRGFHGHFYLLHHFHFMRPDAIFCGAMSVIALLLMLAEWAKAFR